jgi:hypothetical protein
MLLQFVIAQFTTHVFWAVLHEVHGVGQLLASPRGASPRAASIEPLRMQKPSLQIRPVGQSGLAVHAN